MSPDETKFVRVSLESAARELSLRADMAAHRRLNAPSMAEALKFITGALDDAAALLRDRATQREA